jgi:hypothetical protein
MKKFLFLFLAFLTITTTVYASFPVTENLTEQSSEVPNENKENSPDIDMGLLIACIFAGSLGVHRFMMGDTTNGILMLLTLGGCGIWTLIDLIAIATGKMHR